jgi:hypothetical protein
MADAPSCDVVHLADSARAFRQAKPAEFPDTAEIQCAILAKN